MFKKENLRKNFLRVKQNIDQNLGRAEQSKVLTEDQQENEKRVEVVKHAFQNIAKRAGAVLQASGTDFDKKLKKLPEMSLGHAMVESAQSLGTDTLLGSVCQLCGDCQMNLAREQVQYETTVEQDFITPLQSVVDVDIPSIMKFRKALSKSILDMDSAKTRLNQVVRQSQVPGVNMANAAAKADVIKEECEEATLKMENIKDSLSIELCNFASKECEHSNRLLSFLESQANYHKRALEIIEDCIPQMKLAIKNSPAKPCFGMPLEEHLHLMCRDVAIVLEACIVTLLETGMEEEGLFRIAGSALKLKKLKASFDAHVVDMEEFSSDPHTVAGALKQYLRELPEPLLTYDLYEDFMQTATLPQDQRLQALWTVISRLPKANYNNFRYLVKFLAKLAEKSDVNRMKPSNIAIVIGPNLLWSEKSNTPNMMTTGTVSAIIEAIVTHADWFFPGEIDFNIGYTYEDSQDGTQVQPEKLHNSTEVTQLQSSQQPTTQNSVQSPSPGVSQGPTCYTSSSSLPVLPESPDSTSPLQRRLTRKPAPPPPPDRPYTVNVTATTASVFKPGGSTNSIACVSSSSNGGGGGSDSAKGNNSNHIQTGQKTAPLASPESPTEQHKSPVGQQEKDKQKLPSNPSERPLIQPHHRPEQAPPERPKVPPVLNPPVAARGHQRSVSAGALISQKVGVFEGSSGSSGVPNAGSFSSYSISESSQGVEEEGVGSVFVSSAANAQIVNPPGSSSHMLGRQLSLRPRPTPPPPPPPISKESEDTKL